MIRATVERMYTESEENRFLEVTYANGDKEVLYFKDFNSGAMIQNIVDRAKKMAIKDFLDSDLNPAQRGLRVQHMLQACVDEFKENEDLPNTTNPDDWARISGKKGERIVFIRTLITGKQGTEPGRSIDTVANTGQYLESRVSREEDLGHGDIEAALETRRELGARYDAELVDGFAERIERAVDRRVADQVALMQRRTAGGGGRRIRQFALGIISLVAFIPISIVHWRQRRVPGGARRAGSASSASTPPTPWQSRGN